MSEELIVYKHMPVWHYENVPQGLQQPHNTKVGTWAQLKILKGSVEFVMLSDDGQVTERFTFDPEHQPPRLEPQQWHQIVSMSPDIECQMDFLCEPADYFSKRYELTRTHSEVIEAAPQVKVGRALDVGCGNGRNTLYLAKRGFAVDAWDWNPDSLANLGRIAEAEGLDDDIYISEVDLNDVGALDFDGPYDFVFSTVVLMFLQPASAKMLVSQMQEQTAPGGHNLIVSAMDSTDYPCRMPFPFRFQPGELKAQYENAGWEIIKYNENPGKLHKTDENGNRIEMRFATLFARKPD